MSNLQNWNSGELAKLRKQQALLRVKRMEAQAAGNQDKYWQIERQMKVIGERIGELIKNDDTSL